MYGNFDDRGLRMPQYQGGSSYNQQSTSSNFGGMGNTYGQDIGTTPSERMMQGGMGGLQSMMQADQSYNQSGYGQSYGGAQYGQSMMGQGNNQQTAANQFGSYNQNATRDLGTTRSEQSMQGMGGMQTAMQADRRLNNQYGSGSGYASQQYSGNQYGTGIAGGSFGNSGYGGNTSGSQSSNYQDIGTTSSEQLMQGGMGGMQTVMQADRNYGTPAGYRQTGSYGQQSQYGQGGSQYPSGNQYGNNYSNNQGGVYGTESGVYGTQSGVYGTESGVYGTRSGVSGNQYSSSYGNQGGGYGGNPGAAYGTQSGQGGYSDIGTTGSEQMMRGGMGGMQSMMQADRQHQMLATNFPYGYGTQYANQGGNTSGQGYGYSNQYGTQGNYNPGDTMMEQTAKRNINPINTSSF